MTVFQTALHARSGRLLFARWVVESLASRVMRHPLGTSYVSLMKILVGCPPQFVIGPDLVKGLPEPEGIGSEAPMCPDFSLIK